jgi:hypothetical protein
MNGKRTPEFAAYRDARYRCRNRNYKYWYRYGGRGIEFRFTTFDEFMDEIGPRPPGMVLDRIDNNGHYAKGNVRWVTPRVSRMNQRPLPPDHPEINRRRQFAKQMMMRSGGRWAGRIPGTPS